MKTRSSSRRRRHRREHNSKPAARTTRSWRKMNCAPTVGGKTATEETCFTLEILLQLRDAYNKNHSPSERISAADPESIQEALKTRLQQCDTEMCWLDEIQDASVKTKIRHLAFAPLHPKSWEHKPGTWLSNFDIAAVLRQYEATYPHFKLLGPSAIDFNERPSDYGGRCVWDDLCALSLADLKEKGKEKLGISLNLDKHDEDGSHWVSMFVNIPEAVILYYDSACHPIPKQVKQLVKTIRRQGKQLDPPINFTYVENKCTHQRTNGECGMYSLFFIITMLTNNTEYKQNMTMAEKIALFTKPRIPDKYVSQYRRIYFNSM